MGLVLIGFMGTGKSSVAQGLSDILSWDIVEMDQQIVEQEGMAISEIFQLYGEEYFRNLETKLLKALQKKENTIISCGGGTPLRTCNVVEMKKNGLVVLLTADPETVWNRVKEDTGRPLLKNNMNIEYIHQLMENRREKYEAAADVVIATDHKSISQICNEIIEKMKEEEADV